MSGRFLTAEVNSSEPARRASEFFTPLLGEVAQPPLTEIRTVAQMMADQDGKYAEPAELEIPPAEMARIVAEMMDREYRLVLNEPVPALDGKTPRQMARTKAGRARVAEWLKYIEHMTASSGDEHMAVYSFLWMWDELGITELRQ